ncbi:EF-hand domain-containing protein [Cystobacter fuscus]
MSHSESRNRKPLVGAIGVALAGGVLLSTQALAMQPLTLGAMAVASAGEGGCGEAGCGASHTTSKTDTTAKKGTTSKTDTTAKKGTTAAPAAEGKCGEGKCGEGKCGDAAFAHTDSNHDGKVSRAEFLAVAAKRAADFDRIDSDHDGYISEQEAHDFLRAAYEANGKTLPKGRFAHIVD